MKKIINFLVFVFLGILSFSCKNQLVEFTKGYGIVSFGNVSRTVQEEFDEDFSEFTNFVVYARETDSESEFAVLNEDLSLNSYEAFKNASFPLKVGTYDFYLEAFAGEVKFESDEITVEIKENQKTNVNFVLHLVNRGEDNGNVKIKYLFGYYNVWSADFKLFKVEYVDDDKGGKIRTLKNVNVSSGGNDKNPEGDYIWGDPENPEQNCCIFKKSIPAGQYELTARFESVSEGYGTVAEYSTSVSVSEGITSSKEITIENFNPYYAISYTYPEYVNFETDDCPLKYSMYDSISVDDLPRLVNFDDPTETYYSFEGWYTDENFEYPFEGITRYGNMRGDLNLYAKWKLKESQYLLFDHKSVQEQETGEWDDYYKFSMFEENLDIAEISEGNPQIPENYGFPVIGGPDFFYYFSDEGLEKSNDSGVDINLNVDGEQYISSIFYDNETDTLYGRCDEYKYTNNGGLSPTYTYVYEESLLCKYNEDENIFTPIYETKLVHGGDSYMGMSDIFAVHNNKMYFCLKDTDNVKIYIYDGIKGYDENDEEIIVIETSNFGVATFAHLSINDMMFVDGNLYILWSCYHGECDETGIIESFGGVLCVNEEGIVERLFGETTLNNSMKIDGRDNAPVYYYGPSTENSNTQLFGPTKFIAIKPKKLVFADEGIFVYKDTNDSNPEYKNINRVVEIDLANNQIAGEPINTKVSFTKDVEGGIQLYSSYGKIEKAEQTVSAPITYETLR